MIAVQRREGPVAASDFTYFSTRSRKQRQMAAIAGSEQAARAYSQIARHYATRASNAIHVLVFPRLDLDS